MINTIDVINEVQQNFVDSSYDVNTNRAFPNVRDGLKPSQRACLWLMYSRKYLSSKPHVKSAKISGAVCSDLWPHSNTSIYETFIRMSQDFTENSPEVECHGANGNQILGGQSFASERYTECRLAPIVEEGMLATANKHAVPMIWNFSEDIQWPQYLPSVFPRLLVNGAQGLGVSVANFWIGHNFQETTDLILNYLKTDNYDDSEYYPDLPTGCTIVNKDELSKINKTGKGRIIVEAKYEIKGKEIIFTEIPYQTSTQDIRNKIIEKIKDETLTNISDVFDKSEKSGICLLVECTSAAKAQDVLVSLFENTPLRMQYNVNQNGIVSKTPILLTTKKVVDVYIEHNLECIINEHQFEYDELQKRIEILLGYIQMIQEEEVDEVITVIRNSNDKQEAINKIVNNLNYSLPQATAIVALSLGSLTKMNIQKLKDEFKTKKERADICFEIINKEDKQKEVLIKRLSDLRQKYGTPRKSAVIQKDIIKTTKEAKKKEVINQRYMMSIYNIASTTYMRKVPIAAYRENKNNLFSFVAETKDIILVFDNYGKYYRIKPDDIKECGNTDKGTVLSQVLKMESNSQILFVANSKVDEKRPYIVFATEDGKVKKSEKSIFAGNTRNVSGMQSIRLTENSGNVIMVSESNGDYIVLESSDEYHVQFPAEKLRCTGRTAGGVAGIKLHDEAKLIRGKILSSPDSSIKITNRGVYGSKI